MRYSFLLISIVLLVSCKKEKLAEASTPGTIVQTKFDTVKPGSYLPVYPGSWWKYENSSNGIIIDSTAKQYVKDAYILMATGYFGTYTITFSSDSAYVPLYYCHIGYRHPDLMWGYNYHWLLSSYTGAASKPFVLAITDSLPVGTRWTTSNQVNHSWSETKISVKDTNIQIAGLTYSPTIVLNRIVYSESDNYFPHTTARLYYTKEIGLIKVEYLPTPWSAGGEEHLVSYFINKK